MSFRFRGMLRAAAREITDVDLASEMLARAPATLERLFEVVGGRPESRREPAAVARFFRNGWLEGVPRGQPGGLLEQEMGRLFSLCQLLADRYLRLVHVVPGAVDSPTVTYSYTQEREARTYGFRLLRPLRRWFRAPASLFLVHAPLARRTPHYELRLESIDGYYVREQFLLKSSADLAELTKEKRSNVSQAAHGAGVWWATRRGGWTSGFMFIGNGHQSDTRLYAAFRLLEIPPGATGRAFAGTALGALILTGVAIWSLTHRPSEATLAPELLVALVALGSAALDNTTTQRQVFNSPFLPRFALFNQTILAIIAAVWLLARGTASAMLPLSFPPASAIGSFLTAVDLFIGAAIILIALTQCGALAWRSTTAARTYDQAMSEDLA